MFLAGLHTLDTLIRAYCQRSKIACANPAAVFDVKSLIEPCFTFKLAPLCPLLQWPSTLKPGANEVCAFNCSDLWLGT